MNKVFKVIWNTATQSYSVVSELSRAKGKPTKSSLFKLSTVAVILTSVIGGVDSVYAARVTELPNNYFHINTGQAQPKGNPDTNEGSVDAKGGALALRSIAVGENASNSVNSHSSIAIGMNAKNLGLSNRTVTIGENAIADNTNRAVVIGADAKATMHTPPNPGIGLRVGGWQVVIGSKAEANYDSIAIGAEAKAATDPTNANRNNVLGWSTAVGRNAQATAHASTAYGANTVASKEAAVAVGVGAKATALRATALGVNSVASGQSSLADGYRAQATGDFTVAVGNNARAENRLSVAIGSGSVANLPTVPWGAAGTSLENYSSLEPVNSATINGITYGGFANGGRFYTYEMSVGNSVVKRMITNVSAGRINATSTDAINGSQLYMVANEVGKSKEVVKSDDKSVTVVTTQDPDNGSNIFDLSVNVDNETISIVDGKLTVSKNITDVINNSGFKLTTSGNATGTTEELVNSGETVTINGGENIQLTQSGNKISIATKDQVTFGEKGEDGKPGKDGSISVNGKDGSAVVINGKDGSIGLNGKDGENGLTLKSADGAQGIDGEDGENGLPGKNGETRLVYETKDKDGNPVTNEVANLNDGLIFTGNNEALNRHKLNTVVKVVGEGVDKAASENFKSASGNINVKANGTDTLEVQLAKMIDLTEDGSVTTGDTTVNNDGLTIKNGPSVTKAGVNAGGKKVTNVADGEISSTSKDAVNGGQLYNAIQNTGWDLTVDGNVAENTGSTRVANNGKATIKGGNNIVVSRKGSEVTVATSMKPTFDTVTANEVKVGDVTINNNGINAGNKQITNVADGKADSDAVNVRQLNQVKNDVANINNRIGDVDKDLRAGIAGALAAGNLYHVTQPGKSMISAGAGTYRGQGAVALGYSRLSDNGKVGVKFSVNSNSRGHAGAAASVGYQW